MKLAPHADPTPEGATTGHKPRHPLAVPVTGIFVLLLVQALIVGAAFLIPVTSAILGYLILNAPRRVLQRLGVPAPVSAGLFTLVIAAVLVFGGMALSQPIQDFVADIPELVREAMSALTAPGGLLEPFATQAAGPGETIETPGQMPIGVVDNLELATSVAASAPALLSQIVFALCLMFFLVASADMFIEKSIQAFDSRRDQATVLMMINLLERQLGNYLGAITLINFGLGLTIGTAMWIWGLPSPWLIGLMAATLNFIPFVGAVVGAGIAAVIGIVTYGDIWIALGVFGTYYVLTAIEGQLLTPALVGQRLRLNITMVFLSVAFFAWIWSVMGMVVAVPLLIVAKVVCDAVPRLNKVGMFLGDAEGFDANGLPLPVNSGPQDEKPA